MFLALDLQHLAIHRIHLEFDHAAIALQQANFIKEATVVLLELHLQRLALVVAFNFFQHGSQRQYTALFEGLARQLVGAMVIVVSAQQREP